MELLRSCDPDEWEDYERGCAVAVAASSKSPSIQSSSSSLSATAFPDPSSSGTTPDESKLARLRLHDYTIKPIQRICRYPLVFGQLLHFLEEGGVEDGARGLSVLKRAVETTRRAAEQVDRARRRREIECRTLLLASRMEGSSSNVSITSLPYTTPRF
jgi:hypothetical protein